MKTKIIVPLLILIGFILSSCEHNINGPESENSTLAFKIKNGQDPYSQRFFTKYLIEPNNAIYPYKLLKGTSYTDLKLIVLDMTRWKTGTEFETYWDETNQGQMIDYTLVDTSKDIMDNMALLLKKYPGDAYEYVGDYTFNVSDSVSKGAVYVNPGLNYILYAFRENGRTDYYSIAERYIHVKPDSQNAITLYSGGNVPNAPTLYYPVNNDSLSTGSNVYFDWYSSGADNYSLQISTTSNFSNLVFSQTGMTSSYYTVPSLASNRRYYWHVSAENSAGSSGWSSTWTFFIK